MYFAVNTHMITIANLEKEVVKLSHSGTTQQLYEKRQEIQWCRNSLESAQLKLAELSKTLVTFVCEVGLSVEQTTKGWEFGFGMNLEDTRYLYGKGKTPQDAVNEFMEMLG